MHTQPSTSSWFRAVGAYFWPLAVLILLGGAWLRVANLLHWPLWWDEGLHIVRMHAAANGEIFSGLERNKWLLIPLVALFNPTGPEGPFIARYVVTLLGVISVAGCIGLGRSLDARPTGLLAGLIYAVLPMAVFHERQAIFDPMVAALGVVITVLSIRMARRPGWPLAGLIGVLLAAVIFTKLSGITFLAVPVLAVILLLPRRRWLLPGVQAVAAVLLAGGLIFGIYRQALNTGLTALEEYQVDVENTALEGFNAARASLLQRDVTEYGHILVRYCLVIVPLAAAAGLIWAAKGQRRSEILLLFALAFAFAIVPILADKPSSQGRLAPRYLMATIPPMVALAALTLSLALCRFHKVEAVRAFGAACLALILAPALWFSLKLHGHYDDLPYVPGDRRVYFAPVNQNRDMRDTAADLLARWQAGDGQPIGVIMTSRTHILQAYLGSRVASSVLTTERDHSPLQVQQWLLAGRAIYVLEDDITGIRYTDFRHNFLLDEVRTQNVRIFAAQVAQEELAAKLYNQLVPSPTLMQPDYDALASALAAGSPEAPMLIFPEAQQEGLRGQARPLEALQVRAWPMTTEAASAALEAELTETGVAEGQPLDVVLVDEARSDPQRVLALGLQRRLYRTLSEEWFGLLHRITYLNGPAAPDMQPIDAVFEGVIHLEAAAVITEAAPSTPLMLALDWRTDAPIGDSFSVFIHVIDAGQNLTTQYDSIPGSGLLPMPSWQPGERISDRFAFYLPSDLASGRYEVRLGIYNPANGLRLQVSGADAVESYVLLMTLDVE